MNTFSDFCTRARCFPWDAAIVAKIKDTPECPSILVKYLELRVEAEQHPTGPGVLRRFDSLWFFLDGFGPIAPRPRARKVRSKILPLEEHRKLQSIVD